MKSNSIFCTRSVNCEKESDAVVCCVTCEKHLEMFFWSMKSFYLNSGIENLKLWVFNDGSLSDTSKTLIREHFVGCEVIDEEVFEEIKTVFSNYVCCKKFEMGTRKTGQTWTLLKLFGYHILLRRRKKSYAISLDSDILWYRRGEEFLRAFQERKPFGITGGQGREYYVYDPFYIMKFLEVTLLGNFNSGFMGFNANIFDFDFVEQFLEKVERFPHEINLGGIRVSTANQTNRQANKNLGPFSWESSWVFSSLEETIHSALFSRQEICKIWPGRRLDESFEYGYADTTIDRNTVMTHFAGPEGKQFFSQGLSYLRALNSSWLE